MEPKFQKIISKYDYADQLAPGGFVIGGKPALTKIDGDLVGNSMVIVDGRIIAFRGHDSRPTARYCYVNGQKDFVSGITEHLFFPPQPGRHYEGMSAQTGFKHK